MNFGVVGLNSRYVQMIKYNMLYFLPVTPGLVSHGVVDCYFIALFSIKFWCLNSNKPWSLRMPMTTIPHSIGLKYNCWVFTRSVSNQTLTLDRCQRCDWRHNATCISTLYTLWSMERLLPLITFISFFRYCVHRYYVV